MMDQDHGQKAGKHSKSRKQYLVEYENRPTNLDLMPGKWGKGCYISEFVRGKSPNSSVYETSKVIAINDLAVENVKFETIKKHLKTAELPLRLQLYSPNITPKQRPESSRRRRSHVHRSSSKQPTQLMAKKAQSTRLVVNSRESMQKRRPEQKWERRRSTGSWQLLTDKKKTRKNSEGEPLTIADLKVKIPQKKRKSSSSKMKEELEYLRTSLKLVYVALTSPSSEENSKKDVDIPFNRKFAKHFQMMQMILITARMKMAREPDALSFVSPSRVSYGEVPASNGVVLGWNIDQWLGRIIQELGVDRLKLDSRAEECAVSFEAICSLKDTKDMLSDQVHSLEELLKLARKKKSAGTSIIEDFKKKFIDVGQKVEKVVIKVMGLRDRLGSLAKWLTKVEHPWVNRLVSEVRLAPMQASYMSTTTLQAGSPLAKQLESLTSVLGKMVSLVRKSEIVIRGGLVAVPKKDSELEETGVESPSMVDDISIQSFARVPNPNPKSTFLE